MFIFKEQIIRMWVSGSYLQRVEIPDMEDYSKYFSPGKPVGWWGHAAIDAFNEAYKGMDIEVDYDGNMKKGKFEGVHGGGITISWTESP